MSIGIFNGIRNTFDGMFLIPYNISNVSYSVEYFVGMFLILIDYSLFHRKPRLIFYDTKEFIL